MIRDPEELAARRREAAEPMPTDPVPVSVLEQTRAMLARDRADDAMAAPRLWLCRWRSDRHTFEAIAADTGRTVAEVRTGVDRVLQAEGTTLAEVEARLRRPRTRLGRGVVAAPEAIASASIPPQQQQQQLRLVSQ